MKCIPHILVISISLSLSSVKLSSLYAFSETEKPKTVTLAEGDIVLCGHCGQEKGSQYSLKFVLNKSK